MRERGAVRAALTNSEQLSPISAQNARRGAKIAAFQTERDGRRSCLMDFDSARSANSRCFGQKSKNARGHDHRDREL